MAYTPTNWQNGDTITAAGLNNMESGISENDGYWIPLEATVGGFAVPADKQDEVEIKLGSSYYIRGCRISNGTDISGYRVMDYEFHCPFSSEAAAELGIFGPGNLVVKVVDGEGVVVEVVPDVFVVTLTPTGADLSGTTDKTVAEITAAYQAGRKIVYKVAMSETQFIYADVTMVYVDDYTYPSFGAYVIDEGNNLLIDAFTGTTDTGTKHAYSTKIFPLTPMP